MPDLILRATNSPYGDTNKGSVLSQTELDTNFITLKGLDSTNLSLNGSILLLERYSGDNLSIDLSGITSTPFTGGTVIGPTEFLSGLTSDTISATTYYNLPMDVYITGMTFNNGNYDLTINRNDGESFTQSLSILSSDMTITGGTYNPSNGVANFTNNSGGTFNVTGFLTGYTDTYTTGATYSNNTFTFKNSSGTSFNVLFNTMTGLTINGTLSVTGNTGIGTAPSGTYKLDVGGSLRVFNSSFTGGNFTFVNTANNTHVITGGPSGENITFGPTNRIFLNAAQVWLGQSYLTNVGTLETINRAGSAGDALLITAGSIVGAAGITQNAFRFAVTVAQQQASPVANILHLNPTYYNTGTTGTAIVRGLYYNPVLSSLTNTSHIAIQTVSGNNLFGTTSGNTLIGTTVDSGFKLDVSGTTRLNGDLTLTSGTNKTTSVVVLTGGNPSTVVVNNSLVKPSSLILLTKQTAVYSAGTPSILTKTNGSFTIISSANGDTDSVGYLIINTT